MKELLCGFFLIAASPFLPIVFAADLVISGDYLDIHKDSSTGDYELLAKDAFEGPRCAPGRIIVKFRQKAVDNLEEQLRTKPSLGQLKLTKNLDELHARYKIRTIEPLFKNFKEARQQLNTLQTKDNALLTEKEKHILERLKRAPKGVQIPALDRIYKIQINLAKGQSLQDAVSAYSNNPDVEYAELDNVVSICRTPNDPLYPIQWSLNNTGQMYPESGKYNHPPGKPDCDIDAPEAWNINTGIQGIIVAVIDTGVDYVHRDLANNIWFNSDEIAGNGIDDDGNGYIDDVYGYDFCTYGKVRDSDPKDDNGHGTHCAGIISAKGNNGLDITGVCWNASIMVLKFLGSAGSGYTSDATAAFYYAVENGADITSNSWGGGSYSAALQDVINYAHSQGVITVAAAGNDNSSSLFYPACYEHVISVAATNSNDGRASFSNYGSWVDIAAPGVDILSLRAANTSIGTVYNDYTTIASGTSMACPHVAGVCALLLSINPSLAPADVCDILLQTTDPIAHGICPSNGRLGLLNTRGKIRLENDFYSCSGSVSVLLADGDLAGEGIHAVNVTTNAGDLETVQLAETNTAVGIFRGTIPVSTGIVHSQDGILQVSHNRVITATYSDANDGNGSPGTATDTATVDCQAPSVLNIKIDANGPNPTVTFGTSEGTIAHIFYGLTCNDPCAFEKTDSDWTMTYATNHTIVLSGVSPETDYFFVIRAVDAAGNVTIADNGGACYMFTTDEGPRDIYVPSEYSTLKEAISYAWNASTIWLADGRYTRQGIYDFDFKGKAITIKSQNGPENCIIDCASYTGIWFQNGEGPNSVLSGMTVTNGHAAIMCIGSCSPTISNCIFTGNTGRYLGSGIMSDGGSPTIMNCTFTGNGDADCHWGGAIYCWGGSSTIMDCNITNNFAAEGGGGIESSGAALILTNCNISGNQTNGDGGGISFLPGNPGATFGTLTINNCVISNNSAINGGGGVRISNECYPNINNCTIAGNSAGSKGGAFYLAFYNEPNIINSILWANTAPIGPVFGTSYYAYPTVYHSDVQGGWTGHGNINSDPMFVAGPEGGYYLSNTSAKQPATSPCVDAGSDTAEALGMNLSTTRTDYVTDSGIVDMGYHYKHPILSPDINGDLSVDLIDYAMLASQWLRDPLQILTTDISPSGGDGIVDVKDLALLSENWLNCSVSVASNPIPPDTSTNVGLSTILSWSAASGEMIYDVYLGTSFSTVANADRLSTEFKGTISDPSYDPNILRPGTSYYWRIDHVGERCIKTGDIWNFTTILLLPGQASNPVPADGASDVNLTANLSWTAGPDTVSHDVYFGTTNPPPFVGNQTATVFEPGKMMELTTYYWRIDEVNPFGKTVGLSWSFTTTVHPSLIGWWRLDEGAGSVAADSVGSNDGNVVGANWITGQINGALEFDGDEDYVNLSTDSFSGLTQGTISAWVRPATNAGCLEILTAKEGTDKKDYFEFRIFNGNLSLCCTLTRPLLAANGTTVLQPNTWYHVVYSTSDSGNAFYINGSPETMIYADGSSSSNIFFNDIPFGQVTSVGILRNFQNANVNDFNGEIDDVRVYNRALSATEIQQLYQIGE